MKTIKFLAIAAIAICLASCGGKSESENSGVKADSVLNALSDAADEVKDATTSALSDESASTSDESEAQAEANESESASASSSSEDWDALLSSYEEYVDEYISFAKKAKNGDMAAMAEYPKLLQKAQDLSSKLESAKGQMSSAQTARYMKILNKMNQAAVSM
ncbi:MAG: hypothetical protein PUE05_02885 [bacterium]|nr:hypothetical protein [bacterium]